MAKPNYSFAKRQRDLAKKQKKEEKRLRKLEARQPQAVKDLPSAPAEEAPAQPPAERTADD